MSLLKLILFTDSSYSSKEGSISKFKVAGWWWCLRGGGGTENKRLWKGRSLSPTPCRHPRGSYHGAEAVMTPELLGLAQDQDALSQTEGARAWAPANISRQCRGGDGACVSRHTGGAPVCSLLSIELGNAPVCHAVRLAGSCHPVWFYR